MSRRIVVEALLGPPDHQSWLSVGPPVLSDGPPGSISSDEPAGRQVYLFGWLDHDGPGVWRSRGGADLEDPAVRLVMSTGGLLLLAELELEEPELAIWRAGVPLQVRFRLVDDDEPEEAPID